MYVDFVEDEKWDENMQNLVSTILGYIQPLNPIENNNSSNILVANNNNSSRAPVDNISSSRIQMENNNSLHLTMENNNSLQNTERTNQILTEHSGGVRSVSYSPDGRYIASASQDKTIIIWDAVTGEVSSVLEGHQGGVTSISYSPDVLRIVLTLHVRLS